MNVDNLTYVGNLANLVDIESEPNYTFVKADICNFEAMVDLFAKYDVDGVIHLAAESHEGVCSWYDFAVAIAQQSGNECNITPIHSDEYPAKVSRPHYSVLDKTKLKSTFSVAIPHWTRSIDRCIAELATGATKP